MSQRKARGVRETRVDDFRHDATRKNNPPVGLAGYDATLREPETQSYAYDPHLSPQLIWAGKPGLTSIEVEDAAGVTVETVPLHIHERVSTRAILDAVRRPEPKQLGLFADPQLPLGDAIKFYAHDVDWANRLILGDSLVVMNSLAEREGLAGKVQMIYMDPPYGVKYASNFQPRIDRRDVKEDDGSLSREPEMIRAYRDTWTLGVHSYLTYMRDRLRVARELLTESGSIFVQISDENVHRVRAIMDEVFGAENFITEIVLKKTGSQSGDFLQTINDYLCWYVRDVDAAKPRYRSLYSVRPERDDDDYSPDPLTSAGATQGSTFEFEIEGRSFHPGMSSHWKTNRAGMERLRLADRIVPQRTQIRYKRFWNDFPVKGLSNLWDDLGGASDMVYVVQTNTTIIERCLQMTTDPGDLVLDPTCGSGTTAYVAEQWGRRWITMDTSRVALSLARQRLLTATFPYYQLANAESGVDGGFVYKTVPHVTLKSIAQNTRIDPIAERYQQEIETSIAGGADEATIAALWLAQKREIDAIIAEDAEQETLYDQPREERGVVRVAGPFTVEAIPPAALSLQAESPIGGAPQPGANGASEASAETSGGGPHDDAAVIGRLIELMRVDGVTFPGNKTLRFSDLRPTGVGALHAEGEAVDDAELNRVAISFGPQNGAVSALQVEDGLRAAIRGGYDAVIFAGFAFQAEASNAITQAQHPHVKAFMSHIRPDVIMTDARGASLLKTTANAQLFSVFGEPDVALTTGEDGTHTVTLNGVDVYDPIDGTVSSAKAGQIAAWFLDTDYDERAFAICQAFFPDQKAWQKLEKALRGTLNEERFEQLTGTVSLPFEAGQHKRVAVKVIDQRGNEVMRVLYLTTN